MKHNRLGGEHRFPPDRLTDEQAADFARSRAEGARAERRLKIGLATVAGILLLSVFSAVSSVANAETDAATGVRSSGAEISNPVPRL